MSCFFDCNEFNEYRVDLPYPQVAIYESNPRYATLISGAYAGEGSETTAIAQYAFRTGFLHPNIRTSILPINTLLFPK